MKRSEINSLIISAKEFLNEMQFHLPPWAFWSPDDWKKNLHMAEGLITYQLGWDITDFGSENFPLRGLLLFTLRNGRPGEGFKNYAEKVMIVEEEQETPLHFHWEKTEDIINRGGGNLVLELFLSQKDESTGEGEVSVMVDHIERRIPSGEKLILVPGESICLTPGLYHRFYGEKGKGKVLVGEVSSVNDDVSDNRFHERIGRFPEVVEDTPPVHLLVSDYSIFLSKS